LQTARDAISRAGITAADLAAIGVTNQRETTVLWDKATGKPIANAIVWQSRVTAPICDRLKADVMSRPSARRRAWLWMPTSRHQDQAPARFARRPACPRRQGRGVVRHHRHLSDLAPDRRRVHVTDVSNASRTLLFNIHTLQWTTSC